MLKGYQRTKQPQKSSVAALFTAILSCLVRFVNYAMGRAAPLK
jgi:hypothetical protein